MYVDIAAFAKSTFGEIQGSLKHISRTALDNGETPWVPHMLW
jgi:hypothetical protein